jgi:hypothetical protein
MNHSNRIIPARDAIYQLNPGRILTEWQCANAVRSGASSSVMSRFDAASR